MVARKRLSLHFFIRTISQRQMLHHTPQAASMDGSGFERYARQQYCAKPALQRQCNHVTKRPNTQLAQKPTLQTLHAPASVGPRYTDVHQKRCGRRLPLLDAQLLGILIAMHTACQASHLPGGNQVQDCLVGTACTRPAKQVYQRVIAKDFNLLDGNHQSCWI